MIRLKKSSPSPSSSIGQNGRLKYHRLAKATQKSIRKIEPELWTHLEQSTTAQISAFERPCSNLARFTIAAASLCGHPMERSLERKHYLQSFFSFLLRMPIGFLSHFSTDALLSRPPISAPLSSCCCCCCCCKPRSQSPAFVEDVSGCLVVHLLLGSMVLWLSSARMQNNKQQQTTTTNRPRTDQAAALRLGSGFPDRRYFRAQAARYSSSHLHLRLPVIGSHNGNCSRPPSNWRISSLAILNEGYTYRCRPGIVVLATELAFFVHSDKRRYEVPVERLASPVPSV